MNTHIITGPPSGGGPINATTAHRRTFSINSITRPDWTIFYNNLLKTLLLSLFEYAHSILPVVVVVVVVGGGSHIQRIVLAIGETTATHQASHRYIKCQSRLWSQRGTKVNGSHRGDNPLLRPIGIQVATKSYATLQAMTPTNIKTVHQTSLFHIESSDLSQATKWTNYVPTTFDQQVCTSFSRPHIIPK